MAQKQKKRKASNSQKNRKASESRGNIKERGVIQDEIILVIALLLSVLLLLSNFKLGGKVGEIVSSFFFGMVGGVTYIVPFIIFFATAFCISNIGNKRAGRKLISAVVFFIALAALIQMFTNSTSEANLFHYYMNSSKKQKRWRLDWRYYGYDTLQTV
jgi:S-DNA-T family DNA segregation ATPase FtsK/SpoIIIE